MAFTNALNEFYGHITPIVSILDIISVLVVFWGFVVAFLRYLNVESFHHEGKLKHYQELRHTVGIYVVLGLDFMIIADLLNTIERRDLDSIFVLASLILMRALLGYFLHVELHKASDDDKDFQLGIRSVNFNKHSQSSKSAIKKAL